MPKFEKTEPVSAESKPVSLHIPTTLPKVTITYCTQCRWLLRAAYLAQELLSTFDTALGEVALRPTTGGVFTVVLDHAALPASSAADGAGLQVTRVLLWDRKAEGGFPETKVLKQRVRDCVQPGRGLGHSDGHRAKEADGALGVGNVASTVHDGDARVLQSTVTAAGLDGKVGEAEVGGGNGTTIGRDDCETCP